MAEWRDDVFGLLDRCARALPRGHGRLYDQNDKNGPMRFQRLCPVTDRKGGPPREQGAAFFL